MFDFFNRLKIRYKLLLAFGSILMVSISLILFSFFSINRMSDYFNLNEEVNELNSNLLNLNALTTEFVNTGYKSEDFLINGESELLIRWEEGYARIKELEELMASNAHLNEEMKQVRDEMEKEVANYHDAFNQIVDTYSVRGFKDHGLEGTLRAAIHSVEDNEYNYDKAIMLTLRRHEKDFFLRKDLKYLDRFNQVIGEFKSAIIRDTVNTGAAQIMSDLDNYQKKFGEIVEVEKKIGLTTQSGLQGNLGLAIEASTTLAGDLRSLIREKNKSNIAGTFILLPALLVFQLVLGIFLMVFYSNLFTKAITEIRDATTTLAEGDFPETLVIRTKDEIAETKKGFNNLVERIRAAASFAQNLGEGNLSIKYDDQYDNDVLAKSIIGMQDQLLISEAEREETNWSNRGLALFNDILRNDEEKLETLGDNIIRQMVQYLNANQGALYILQENGHDAEVLKRISTYAFDRKKYVNQEIAVGEGLVGQCVLEKDTIYLTDIPADYINITSGLGDAPPTCLLVVPLMMNEQVMGVIELASFNEFKDFEVEFVKKISETIANILLNKSNHERNISLLSEAKEKAEMLANQEEELRQNAEELMATQEDMKRQREEMEKEIELLREQLKLVANH